MSVFFVNSDNDNEDSHSTPTNSGSSQLLSEAHQSLQSFWPRVTDEIRKIGQVRLDLKTQALPLARIKKIMKLDEDVKMISAEAPMLFSKAAELFIHELTLRAWIHTEDNKRRTLQRNDIAMAITKYDQFDFLIDIVPRDEVKPATSTRSTTTERTSMNPDQVHYYFQLAQHHQAALQQSNSTTNVTTPTNTAPQTIQVVQQNPATQLQTITVNPQEQSNNTNITTTSTAQAQPQVVQLQTAAAPQATTAAATGGIQLVQQIVTPSGEVQQIPIQLTPNQIQMIRMQIQGNASQPIILQAQQPQIFQVNQQFLSQATTTNNTSEAE